MNVEFWVMRVLLHPGPMSRPVRMEHLRGDEAKKAVGMITAGELACLPDGCIAEPMEVFAEQNAALDHADKLKRDRPGEDFRVILNADVVV